MVGQLNSFSWPLVQICGLFPPLIVITWLQGDGHRKGDHDTGKGTSAAP